MKIWFRPGWLGWLHRFWPGRRLFERYRVIPGHKSDGFRRELLRDVHRKLRQAGLVSSRRSPGTSA